MPEDNIITPPQLEQGAMIAGEDYEYVHGTYLARIKEELAAMTHQYELQKEHEEKYGLFGERNMAILSAALSGRKVVENLRQKHIDNLVADSGGEGAAGITYDEKDGVWRTATGDIADFISKDKVEGGVSPFGQIANSLLGWHSGILKLEDGKLVTTESDKTDEEQQIDSNVSSGEDEDEGAALSEEIASSVSSDKILANKEYKDMSTLDLANQIDPSDANMDSELVKEFQRRTGLNPDGKFGRNTTATWQDTKGIQIDEELGDDKPDDEWNNLNTKDETLDTSGDEVEDGTDTGVGIDVDTSLDDEKVSTMTEKYTEFLKENKDSKITINQDLLALQPQGDGGQDTLFKQGQGQINKLGNMNFTMPDENSSTLQYGQQVNQEDLKKLLDSYNNPLDE